MKRFVLALLLAVAWPTVTWAECAWVLWNFPTGKFYYMDGNSRKGEVPRHESPKVNPFIGAAYPTYEECVAARAEKRVPEGGEFGQIVKYDGTSMFMGLTEKCLPDTVDPRAPKGK